MSTKEIEQRVIRVISDQMCMDSVTVGMTYEEMDVDSLDSVEVIMALEEEFEIEIPDREAEVKSVQDAVDLICRRIL